MGAIGYHDAASAAVDNATPATLDFYGYAAAAAPEAGRSPGHARLARAEDVEPRTASRLRHRRPHPDDLRRHPARGGRVAVSGAPSHGIPRLDRRRVADDREQPPRADLQADARGREAPRRRAGEVDAPDQGRHQSPALRLAMGWLRRLRNSLSNDAASFDEEARFHLDHRIDEYVRGGMTRDQAERAALKRFGSTGPYRRRRWLPVDRGFPPRPRLRPANAAPQPGILAARRAVPHARHRRER